MSRCSIACLSDFVFMYTKKLTRQQELFVEHYLATWHGVKAARLAGYAMPEKQGSRLMKNPLIVARIQERLAQFAMPANEALARLAEQARVNIADFIVTNGNGFTLNWEELQRRGHLVKAITMTRSGPKIELYDAQGALDKIAKILGLFNEKQEVAEKVRVELYIPEQDSDE